MDESIYIGAYWGARSESLEACTKRIWSVLIRLKEISPLFERWYPKKKSAQELRASSIKSIDTVRAMLSKARNRRDDNGEVIDQLGFGLSAWNDELDESKSLDISIHLGGTSAYVKNNLVMRLPRASYRLSEQQSRDLLKVIIEATDPEYATISSRQCRERLAVKREFVFGWEGYVRGIISTPHTTEVTTAPFGLGTIMRANLERFSVDNPHHLAAVKELNKIGGNALKDGVHLSTIGD